MPWSSEPVTTTSKFQASWVVWPMTKSSGSAQNKTSNANPNPSSPLPCHPAPNIHRKRLSWSARTAEKTAFCHRGIHQQHGLRRSAWLCQSVPTTSKPWCRLTLPEWHDLRQGKAEIEQNLFQKEERKSSATMLYITWSLSAPRSQPPDPTTSGRAPFGCQSIHSTSCSFWSTWALQPADWDCLALEGPSKHWTSDPSPLFHILHGCVGSWLSWGFWNFARFF